MLDMTTPGEARETDIFTVPGLFHPVPAGSKAAAKPVEAMLYKPTEGQMSMIMRLSEALERGHRDMAMINSYTRILASLFVDRDTWLDLKEAIEEGRVDINEYGPLLLDVLRRFFPQKDEAPRTGPQPTRRRAQRARA